MLLIRCRKISDHFCPALEVLYYLFKKYADRMLSPKSREMLFLSVIPGFSRRILFFIKILPTINKIPPGEKTIGMTC